MYKVISIRFFYSFLLFFIGICSACSSYRTLEVEILSPAKITLEREGKIGFLDRQISRAADTTFVLYSYQGISPAELSFLFFSGLQDAYRDIQKGDSIPELLAKTRTYLPARDTLPRPLSKGEVEKICEAYQLAYLISLETYSYTINMDLLEVRNKYTIRLYSRYAEKPLDFVVLGEDLSAFLNDDYDFVTYIRDKAWETGFTYAHRIMPYWSPVKRRIYNGQKVLKIGDLFLQKNDVEEARKLWEAATQLSPGTALKAYINLAWLSENEGNFAAALEVLQKAQKLASAEKISSKDKTYLEEYIEILKKRIQEMQIIEKQMK